MKLQLKSICGRLGQAKNTANTQGRAEKRLSDYKIGRDVIMNLVGQKVVHTNNALGVGKIIEQSDVQIKIQFESRTIDMQFPEAFANFVTLEDSGIQKKILLMIEDKRKEKEEEETKQREKLEYIRRQQNTIAKCKKVKKSKRPSIAFKLTYCDGGKDDRNIGFYGICSPKMRALNIKKKRNWCINQECNCNKYINGKISKEVLYSSWEEECCGASPCYDSIALRDWSVATAPGKRFASVELGHLCILTTQLPNDDYTDVDKERVVVGLFIIGRIEPAENDNDRIYAVEKDDYLLSFTFEEAKRFKYWDIASTSTNPDNLWGSGLYRNLDDDMAIEFLKKAIDIKKDVAEKEKARKFLHHYCEINGLTVEAV